ncbi:MAG: hypothetical protein HW403_758 [Dehalococcoidia bacterium]|nr:hypothetical protein [Dehalococcoidia bacterium]
MGAVRRVVRFGSEDGNSWVSGEATIDTGATHCQVPSSVARDLNARLFRRSQVLLADGSIQERDIVYVQLELDPSLPPALTTAVVGEEGAPYLVGVVALEVLGVGVDPVTRQLVPDMPTLLRSTNWPTF